MRIPTSLANSVRMEFTGADIAGFLTKLSNANISLRQITRKDTLSVCATFSSMHTQTVIQVAKRCGVKAEVIKSQGYIQQFYIWSRRLILLTGILFLFVLSIWIPSKILIIEVTGNRNIPTSYIQEVAQQCGIRFGADRDSVRSEVMKNKLLQALPQLQWAGVNTYGCRAVISVTEKEVTQKTAEPHTVGSMVATVDGIIDSVTVTKGNTLCSVGQAVKKGQVLISGYLDLGNKIQATRAEGEIFAHTQRSLTLISPQKFEDKNSDSIDKKNFSIIFGKTRINLSKNSGISIVGCDKIYKEYPLTLPGGYTFPLALAVEQWKSYNEDSTSFLSAANTIQLPHVAQSYLSSQMISGKVIGSAEKLEYKHDFIYLKGTYSCHEMIGRMHTEEIIDGKDN